MTEAAVGKRPWREKVYPSWLPLVLAMGLVWRRRWWRFLFGGLNRPLIFLALFAWNLKHSAGGTQYLCFLLPGLVVMAAVTASYTDLVNWFTLRRTFYRALDEYLLAPVSTGSLLAGHVLAGGGKGLLTALAVCLAGWTVVGGLRFSALFLVQLAVVCLLFASLAVAVAMIAGGDKDVLMFTNLIVFPMTFFCGTFFPVEQLPGVLAYFSWFLPLTAATYNLRALALTGTAHWDWFGQSLGWLAGSYALAYALLCWRRQD
ncbi:ABC transporter permease [Candidatus Desulforudis audaxviator]|uniref:Transport permease protein n=1 Tax=Desulforudis audaxviator (strain MP104C) TaxID=477974 RepID=B1I3V5_DESAP|nr:ABC transporter permease [Candidatus Desulforudis audaxviator]ACA59723.1 ABC-2 type transporter [Candidatus Desulforudis audaxviator MP104C]AZK59717.1 ABC-2 transporter, permease protein [Candidatus Desulforudis audaxviator]